jgi:glycerol-3-phosphate dehydrogenase
MRRIFDLAVVGGGINGAGIARDAAGRGLSVLLCEQDDLAAHTSSASTKLIHGGLRYLEYRDFGLVRKSLQEREVVLGLAPHIMWPLRFVMPHEAHLRPAWLIRLGLLLYDNLGRRRHLPGSAALDLRRHPAGAPLASHYRRGFVYSDGWVDDARLVVLNAQDAAERGATVLTRTRCEQLTRGRHGWLAELHGAGGEREQVSARAVVNATGPWVVRFLHGATPVRSARGVRLVRGSHIVLPRLFEHRFAYIFQNPDKRIVFAIPYEQDFTLVGTTDVEHRGEPQEAHISPDEVTYLCETVNRYFTRRSTPQDVLWTFSGVRPLIEDDSENPSSVTRDYAFELDERAAPLLSIFGGKITTFRKLAEEAVNVVAPRLQCHAPPWTAGAVLPGGDLPERSFAVFLRTLERHYGWLPAALRVRYAHGYGTRMHRLLGGAVRLADLGEEVLPQLHAREIEYLRREEWARTAADILWRRTKLGLRVPPGGEARLEQWLAQRACAATQTRETVRP